MDHVLCLYNEVRHGFFVSQHLGYLRTDGFLDVLSDLGFPFLLISKGDRVQIALFFVIEHRVDRFKAKVLRSLLEDESSHGLESVESHGVLNQFNRLLLHVLLILVLLPEQDAFNLHLDTLEYRY